MPQRQIRKHAVGFWPLPLSPGKAHSRIQYIEHLPSSTIDPISEPVTASASELTSAEFGTLHYGCRGEITSVLFNDGPEATPFMVTVEVEGGQRGGGGGAGGAEVQDGKEKLPFEVGTATKSRVQLISPNSSCRFVIF